MGWKNRIVERGKQLAMTPRVLRVLSDDRVMRAAEGVMDARTRMRAAAQKAGEAWQLLTHGHALPAIDPSLTEDGGEVTSGSHSPMLDVGIGMGYVPAALVEPGTELVVDVRGKPRRARVVEKPFYTREER